MCPTDIIQPHAGLDIPALPIWQGSSGRLKRTGDGVWAITSDDERRDYVMDGVFAGILLEPAATIKGLPVQMPSTTGSEPQSLTLSNMTMTVSYATQHSEPDHLGGTGDGILVTNTAAGQSAHFTQATHAVVSGDIWRMAVLFYLKPALGAQTFSLRANATSGTVNTGRIDAMCDSTGTLTSISKPGVAAGDVYQFDTLPTGEKVYYAWADLAITASATLCIQPTFSTASMAVVLLGVQSELNPTEAVPSLPVYEDKTFLADSFLLSNTIAIEAEFVALACGRTRVEAGNPVSAPTSAATPFPPVETRVILRPAVEPTNLDYILPSPKQDLAFVPRSLTTHIVTIGDAFLDVDLVIPSSFTGTYTIQSAFSAPERMGMIRSVTANQNNAALVLGVHLWKRTNISSVFDFILQPKANTTIQPGVAIYGCAKTHTRDHGTAIADDAAFGRQNCEYYGRIGSSITSDYSFSADGMEVGYVYSAFGGFSAAGHVGTVSISNSFIHDANSDLTILSVGEQSWSCTGNIYYNDTYRPLDFVQAEDEIEVDIGAGRVPLSASSFSAATLPVARKFAKYGTRSLAGGAIAKQPDANAWLYVTDWSARSGVTDKTGFQYYATRPQRIDGVVEYESPVVDFEVYVSDNGAAASPSNPHIYITTQLGKWTNASTYAASTTPAASAAGIHGDVFQMATSNMTLDSLVYEDNLVLSKSQGLFLSSAGEGVAGASVFKSLSAQRNLFLVAYDNALTVHGPNDPGGSPKVVSNNFICGVQETLRFASGQTPQPKLLASGATAQLSGSGNVVAVPTGGVATSVVDSASAPSVDSVGAYAYTDFTTLVAAPGTVTTDHIFDASCLDPVSHKPLVDLDKLTFTPMASALLGFDTQASVDAKRAGVYGRNSALRAMVVAMSQPPEHRLSCAASASVGSVLLSGLEGRIFDRKYGGNGRELFTLDGGVLKVSKSLTGMNALLLLITDAGEKILVDIQ